MTMIDANVVLIQLEYPLSDSRYEHNFYYKLLLLFWLVLGDAEQWRPDQLQALLVYFYCLFVVAVKLLQDDRELVQLMTSYSRFTVGNVMRVFNLVESRLERYPVKNKLKDAHSMMMVVKGLCIRRFQRGGGLRTVDNVVQAAEMFDCYARQVVREPALVPRFQKIHDFMSVINFNMEENLVTV